MTTQEMTPQNALEEAMAEARAGTLGQEEFLRRLLQTPVFIPSRQEVQADGSGLAPLVLDRAGVPFAAVFTSAARLQSLGGQIPYCLEMPTSAFLPRLPAGYGLVVNPGYALRMEIEAYGIENIIKLLIAPEPQ